VIFENGLLSRTRYHRLLEMPEYRELEAASQAFLARHPATLAHYRWVRDPFHQWSRRWEYPFVYHVLARHIQELGGGQRVLLDAGSGITFFPYCLVRRWKGCEVLCCDADPALAELYQATSTEEGVGQQVRFLQADLRQLPHADASVDMAYSISVLEHTDDYGEIVSQLARVLRPGGLLALTFDIGLDGVSRMSPSAADALMNVLDRYFETNTKSVLSREVCASDVLTSDEIGLDAPESLPWRYPRLSLLKAAFAARRLPSALNKRLTCYCGAFVRRLK